VVEQATGAHPEGELRACARTKSRYVGCPTDPSKLVYVDCGLYPYDSTLVLVGATEAAMSRKLVWIERKRFRGFGCSACTWRFKPSGAPEGKSFDEMMRNFELQRDQEFKSHVCADQAAAKNPA
jgi:hypothetical protein